MSLENCKFKAVPGYDNHAVDLNTGEIYRFVKLKPYENKFGYLRVRLTKSGKYIQHFVHKIVLSAVKEFWVNGLEIDHKDKNRHNNHPDNLEHVTRSTNMHRRDNGYDDNQIETQGSKPF